METIRVRRALISVSDKTGLEALARGLHEAGVELVASGGTAAAIRTAGVPVTPVSDVTGQEEMLGGRVKTLHPNIHAAILADLGDPAHLADLEKRGIEPFQLVVTDLYPFEQTTGRAGVDPADVIEQIDIGGPAMTRAAAKNHAWVAIVTSPSRYPDVLEGVRNGGLDLGLRKRLASEAFFRTAAYDAAIVGWFERDEKLPERLVIPLEHRAGMRYGENPHQAGARYAEVLSESWWETCVQHQGLDLSYLNVFDTAAAWKMVHDLGALSGRPTCVIVKHGNPCGAAAGDTPGEAYVSAYECDPQSAFGGIVAFDQTVDVSVAEQMATGPQADVVIAPGYGPGATERLHLRRKSTRVLEAGSPSAAGRHFRQIEGGWLVQDRYGFWSTPESWEVVTARKPTGSELVDAAFAFRVCGHVTSNAIVMARDSVAWGIGAGQPNRADSAEIAVRKAAGRAAGGACASDAFFPFPDGVEAAARAGVAVVVQPGGSVRDTDVIARADELGLSMLFTGERQFRH